MRKGRFAALLLLISALIIIYLVRLETSLFSSNTSRTAKANYDFTGFNNTVGSSKLLVPNIIHYIVFDRTDIDFVMFVCMLSAWLNHRPSQIMLHTNVKINEKSKYFTVLRSVMGSSLLVQGIPKPSHVFGIKLAIVHHAADVARIQVLSQYGGIYLDWDVFVVKSLNPFRHFECSIGWPESQYIGNQVIIAHKNARFLKLWLQTYRDYHPTEWYYNGGEVPTKQILIPHPEYVHRVKTGFGVESLVDQLYKENWSDYVNRYTVHLLANHKYLHEKAVLTEEEYNNCNCTFATLVNSVLNQIAEDQLIILNTAALDEKLTKYLSNKIESHSLLKKHLTQDILVELKQKKTSSYHSTIYDVVKTGLANPDSSVGVLVPDTQAYSVFQSLLLPIIRDYHHLPEGFAGQPEPAWGRVDTIGKFGQEVISTRIRIARSIAGYPLNSKMTKQNLIDLEQAVRGVLEQNFAGTYHPLLDMSPEFRQDLVNRHFMFEDCDRFNKGGGGCQHWPHGRGIFISADEKFLVWLNEEDHLRIISMDKGGDLNAIYKRLVDSMNILEGHLKFAHDPYLGFLTYCPTNIGTTLRASVHLKFNNLKMSEVKTEAKMLGLQVRGTHGEHSDVRGGVMDISNARRLGLTEFEAINQVYTGVNNILDMDRHS